MTRPMRTLNPEKAARTPTMDSHKSKAFRLVVAFLRTSPRSIVVLG